MNETPHTHTHTHKISSLHSCGLGGPPVPALNLRTSIEAEQEKSRLHRKQAVAAKARDIPTWRYAGPMK